MSRIAIVFILCFTYTVTIYSFPSSDEEGFSARSVGRSLAKCLGEPKLLSCLETETLHNLDLILRDNSTWQYSDFIQFEKDQNFTVPSSPISRSSDFSVGEEIAEKLVQLAQARTIRLRVNARALEQETQELNPDEGRKKKDKDKGMGMFGGIAMVAMMAQMFLGKVMLIAGSAFVMAKIALLVSLLTSLKTKSSGGGNTEHVVTYADSGGGHGGGHSGWHRSLPNYTPPTHTQVHEPVEEEHHSSPQIPDYYQYEASNQKQDYKFI